MRTSSTGSTMPCPKKCAQTMFARFFAKNVCIPIEALGPSYTYTGETLRFKAGRDATDGAVSAAVQGGTATGTSKEDAAKLIADFLIASGIDRNKADVSVLSHTDIPQAARIEPFLTAAALGELATTLSGFGV